MAKNDLSLSLEKTLADLTELMSDTAELNVVRGVVFDTPVAVVSAEGMVSAQQVGELVLRPLSELGLGHGENEKVFDLITDKLFFTADRKLVYCLEDICTFLFSGFAVILVRGECRACALGLQGFEMRSVGAPEAEQTVHCAQDSFTETVRVNMSLIRRRLKSPKLVIDMLSAGRLSKTDICIVYLKDRVPEDIIRRIKEDLNSIKLDAVLTSGYAEPFVDESFSGSVFSSVSTTQRPDLACTRLVQGRVCVLIDGTPFALVVPSLFAESFQTMDDFSQKPYYTAFMRWIRYISFFLSVGFPGLYVALADHHPEVFSLKLLLNLSVAEEATPYPLMAEVVMLMVFFEIMREAGLRLPKAAGSAVSIVGGLIIGDAAVKSGIVSAPLLIVVGITATASFVTPQLEQPAAVLRLIFILAGGLAGLFGLAVCFTVLVANVCAMNDFSVSFLSPAAPLYPSGIKDIIYMKSFREYEKSRSTLSDIREAADE